MSRLTRFRVPGWMARLLVIMMVSQMAIFLIRPVLSYRAIELGAGELEIGVLVAMYGVLPAFIALPVGRYSDLRRPAPVLQASLVLVIAGAVVFMVAPSLLVLGVGTALLGVGATCAQMFGPAVGGLILSGGMSRHDATTAAFIVGAVMIAVSLAFAWGFADAARRPPVDPRSPGRHSTVSILRLPGVMGGMFASLSLLTAVDILVAYLPLLGERRGISPAVIGVLLSIRAAASVLSRVSIPVMLRRWGRGKLLLASTFGSGLLFVLLPVTSSIWVMAAILVAAGFFLGIGQPLTMSLVVQAVPPTVRGAALSLRIMGNKIGQVTLPAIVAVATGAAGAAAAFVVLGGVLMMSAAGVPRGDVGRTQL